MTPFEFIYLLAGLFVGIVGSEYYYACGYDAGQHNLRRELGIECKCNYCTSPEDPMGDGMP